MQSFWQALKTQRWDDHRYYHHSRINQSLHLLSASSFVCAYFLMFSNPAAAALLAWLVSMTSRQAGHFFFEPKGYDEENDVSHQYKEDVKVGYNLFRKWVLMSLWAAVPVTLWFNPTLFGTLEAPDGFVGFLRHVGIAWLMLGVGAIIVRVTQLTIARDAETGIVWATKIVTDPFNDFKIYRTAPVRLLKGERVDEHVAA